MYVNEANNKCLSELICKLNVKIFLYSTSWYCWINKTFIVYLMAQKYFYFMYRFMYVLKLHDCLTRSVSGEDGGRSGVVLSFLPSYKAKGFFFILCSAPLHPYSLCHSVVTQLLYWRKNFYNWFRSFRVYPLEENQNFSLSNISVDI